jgi:hypothetical protein
MVIIKTNQRALSHFIYNENVIVQSEKGHSSPNVDDDYIHIKTCANPYVTSFKENVK